MSELLLKFFIFSFFGCFLECGWHYLFSGCFRTKRMMYSMPACPVYGIGAVLFTVCLDGFYKNPFVIYALGAVIATGAEFLFYAFFRIKYNLLVWDYREKKLNFEGGVCLEYTLLWGLVAVIYVYFAEKAADTIIFSMSEYLKMVILVVLGFITAADMKETLRIFGDYNKGKEEKLPDCFWYIVKI